MKILRKIFRKIDIFIKEFPSTVSKREAQKALDDYKKKKLKNQD